MDYKERWNEIFEELKEERGKEPEGIEVDQALGDYYADLRDYLRKVSLGE